MEYAIYDAAHAGFDKVVLVINRQLPIAFMERLNKISNAHGLNIEWVYQDMDRFVPKGFNIGERQKPWGTSHAVLCAKEAIAEPFAVINADDYYGQSAYTTALNMMKDVHPTRFGLIAYVLKATLSSHGGVSRGICEVDNGFLRSITERTSIAISNGAIYAHEMQGNIPLDGDRLVSMNFWIFHESVFSSLEAQFLQFLAQSPKLTEECYLPELVQHLISKKFVDVKVEVSQSIWKGITYPEDKVNLKIFLQEKTKQQQYPDVLWNLD